MCLGHIFFTYHFMSLGVKYLFKTVLKFSKIGLNSLFLTYSMIKYFVISVFVVGTHKQGESLHDSTL